MSDAAVRLAEAGRLQPDDPIVAIELHRVRLPLRSAHRAAHGTEAHRELIIVHVRGADGADGWGECPTLASPGYLAETTDVAWEALVARLCPAVVRGASFVDGSMAAAALTDALTDRSLRRDGLALADLLDVAGRAVPSAAVLGIPEGDGSARIDDLLADAVERRAQGSAQLKLKVCPGWSTAAVRAIVDAFPGATIAADANGSFLPGSDELAQLDAADLRYLEQPCAPSVDPNGLGLVTTVALDESLTSADEVLAWSGGPGRLVNLKPSRLGGVAAAVALAEAVAALPGGVFVGGMLESGLGRGAAVTVAAYVDRLDPEAPPTDVGPSQRYVDEDLTDPVLGTPAGEVLVPRGLGLGAVPDAVRLGRWTLRHARVGA